MEMHPWSLFCRNGLYCFKVVCGNGLYSICVVRKYEMDYIVLLEMEYSICVV